MSSDENRSVQLSIPAHDHQRFVKTVTTIYFLHCSIDNIPQKSLWIQYLSWLYSTILRHFFMTSMISLQQKVIMLYYFLEFSPVVRQNPTKSGSECRVSPCSSSCPMAKPPQKSLSCHSCQISLLFTTCINQRKYVRSRMPEVVGGFKGVF